MNIATKLVTALTISAAMTSVVISGESEMTTEKPVILASLIIVPTDEGDTHATLGAARSLNLNPAVESARVDNDAMGAESPATYTASLFQSDAFIIYQQEFKLDPVPVPTPRPQFRPQQASAPAVTPAARPAPAQRAVRTPVRQQRMAAMPEAETSSRLRLRERPIFFGVFR